MISGAGNGWGKSEILAAIFAAIMWPTLAPQALAGPAFSDWKFPKRARIYSKPAELESIGSLQTAISRLFPAGRYVAEKGRYSYPSVFHTDTGWILDLFSYERHESEAAGPNIGLQAFNEPPPEPLWKEAVARSRAGGYIIGGMTSLFDNSWVVDGLLGKNNGRDIRIRYGSSCENCKTHGKDGNLNHDQIANVLAQYDPDEREARFSGKPLSMSGRIYKRFSREVHVVSEQPVPSNVNTYQVVDPAIGKPLAIIYAYVTPSGVVRIYDEWPNFPFEGSKDSSLSITDYVNLFRNKEGGIRIGTRIIDRHFANARRTLNGPTLKDEFREKGIEFFDSYKLQGDESSEVETGIMAVKEYLRYDPTRPLSALNRPLLEIQENCTNTIAAMEKWSRDPKTFRPKESYKDFADCTRYLCKANPEFEIARPWGDVRQPNYGLGQV